MLSRIKSKKGDMGFFVGIIIVLAAFFIIALFLREFMTAAEPKQAEALCQSSIALKARSTVNIDSSLVGGKIKPVPVLCKTIDRKISGTREEILEQVAYSMARCWWMFGEGRYEETLHGNKIELLPSLLGTGELKNKCFNCYNLMIDQDEIEGGPIKNDELIKFMYERNHPQLQNVTYLQYIQSYGGPGMMGFLAPEINARNAYAISILPVTKEKGSTNWVKLFSYIGTGLAIGGAIACGAITGGACAVAILAVKVAATTAVTSTVLGASDEKAPSVNVNLKEIFEERELSSIYLSNLATGQEFCGSGDLAGE